MPIKRKKKGFSFIQSIFTFFLILIVFNLCLIFINYNYYKAETFYTYSDIKSLSYEEEEFLVFINENVDLFISSDLEDFEEKKNKNSKFSKYNLKILNNKYYITKEGYNNKMYIKLEKITSENDTIFIPSFYKTDYIVGD